MGVEHELARVRVEGARCPFCHEAVAAAEEKRACEACMAWSHAECWRDHGACAACAHRDMKPAKPARGGMRSIAGRAIGAAVGVLALLLGVAPVLMGATDPEELAYGSLAALAGLALLVAVARR